MTVGETLLKFTDYPFAYSLVFIASGMLGFSITQNKFYLVGIAGAFGTLLTIADPGGAYVRYQLERRVRKNNDKNFLDYQINALQSRAIGIEVDRIVAMIYFVLTAFIFLVGMVIPTSPLPDNFIIYGQSNEITCDSNCVILYSIIGCFGIFGVLSIFAHKRWLELDDKVITAGLHQYAIGNEYATVNSVENMTTSINLGDWTTANKWGEKILEEIKYKRGKREIIIGAAETIFRPLHEESVSIEQIINRINESKKYTEITFQTWTKIKNESTHVMIDDTDLRKRITNFYNKISDYNKLIIKSNRRIEKLIIEIASKIYSRKVRGLKYWVIQEEGSHASPETFDCVMNNLHPLKVYENSTPLQVDIQFKTKNGNDETETMEPANTEFHKFEEFWEQITKIVNSDPDILKIRQLCNEIEIENKKLQVKYTEQIELQWKV